MVTKSIKRLQPKVPADAKLAAADMSVQEAKYVLDDYLAFTGIRQSTKLHARALTDQGLDNTVMRFLSNSLRTFKEYHCRGILDIWSDKYPEAKWAKSIRGIGPAIAAGFAAYIEFDKIKSASSLAKFGGFTRNSRRVTMRRAEELMAEAASKFGEDPTDEHVQWLAKKLNKDFTNFSKFSRKKDKPYTWGGIATTIRWPSYNPTFRRICNMAGNCFMKHRSMYQDLYLARKAYEQNKNQAGEYKYRAEKQLKMFNYKPWKEAYKIYTSGMLPISHINASAKRYAIKIFLAHYYIVGYSIRTGETPRDAYGLDILKGHRKIHVPNWEKVDEGK